MSPRGNVPSSGPAVSFDLGRNANNRFSSFVEATIDRTGAVRICDAGGGASPLLPLDLIKARNLDYTVLDISREELDKAPDGYRKVQGNLLDRTQLPESAFDLVFSRMLVEHLRDPQLFHANMRHMLAPGGRAIHWFPTLYALPFLINRVIPDSLSQRLLTALVPYRRQQGTAAKFPAYYKWCRGPTRRQLLRFEDAGFEVEEYVGFFGTYSYYRRVPVLQRLEDRFAATLVRHPVALATSYAYVVLKPVA